MNSSILVDRGRFKGGIPTKANKHGYDYVQLLTFRQNLPSQSGRVFIVTGGSSGLGYEISRILYGAGGRVYILTRSREHAEEAIAKIEAHYSGAGQPKTGSLVFLYMDLLDFATNAPPSRQGDEYHFVVNSLGPYLLTRLLTPILTRTAQSRPKDSVRVIWPASVLVEMTSPRGGMRKGFLQDAAGVTDENELYASSKTGNWFLASELARRLLYYVLWPILGDPVRGAETYPWMAFSESVTAADCAAGRYAICDGRWHPGQREDLVLALRSVGEGGSGRAGEYREWCEDRIKDLLAETRHF